MAKISVVGNAVVFESGAKLEDLALVKKYRPEALCVKDEDEEIKFICTVAPGSIGDVDAECAIFGMATHDEEKHAVVTKLLNVIPESAEELKEMLADKLGAAVTYMNKLEETLPGVLEEVKAERAAVMEAIEIA